MQYLPFDNQKQLNVNQKITNNNQKQSNVNQKITNSFPISD